MARRRRTRGTLLQDCGICRGTRQEMLVVEWHAPWRPWAAATRRSRRFVATCTACGCAQWLPQLPVLDSPSPASAEAGALMGLRRPGAPARPSFEIADL